MLPPGDAFTGSGGGEGDLKVAALLLLLPFNRLFGLRELFRLGEEIAFEGDEDASAKCAPFVWFVLEGIGGFVGSFDRPPVTVLIGVSGTEKKLNPSLAPLPVVGVPFA